MRILPVRVNPWEIYSHYVDEIPKELQGKVDPGRYKRSIGRLNAFIASRLKWSRVGGIFLFFFIVFTTIFFIVTPFVHGDLSHWTLITFFVGFLVCCAISLALSVFTRLRDRHLTLLLAEINFQHSSEGIAFVNLKAALLGSSLNIVLLKSPRRRRQSSPEPPSTPELLYTDLEMGTESTES